MMFIDDDDNDDMGGIIRYSSRFEAVYVCEKGHETSVTLSTDAEVPPDWECATCAQTAILKNSNAEVVEKKNPKAKQSSPWDKLLERRTPQELEDALSERLKRLRSGEEIRIFTI
jgi:hypothetical protein